MLVLIIPSDCRKIDDEHAFDYGRISLTGSCHLRIRFWYHQGMTQAPENQERITVINAICPLCDSTGPFPRLTGPMGLGYLLCGACQLIFMERQFLPTPEQARAHYETHQNGPQYAGYVQFLNQAISPALPYLETGMHGLDYGSGPGPTLSLIMETHGMTCENYDPIYAPALPEKIFDYVFATEVVEHFIHPAREFRRIQALLRPGGTFTVMTIPWSDLDSFTDWFYAKDFTHVSFYHTRTMDYVCAKFGFAIRNHENTRVWVMERV
jgi:hypothetical protein